MTDVTWDFGELSRVASCPCQMALAEKELSITIPFLHGQDARATLTRIAILVGVILFAGCCPPPTYYTGPTDSMAKVVADINANNSKVATLWAHHYFEADVVDDKHSSHHIVGDGKLLFMSPKSMRLVGNSGIIGQVFDIGTNPQSFWLKLSPDTGDAMWWGTWANLAQANPDALGIPIRPDMVFDVLGIATINANFLALPAPTMRFNNEITKEYPGGAYVFIWIGQMPDRWVALREVWYDRITKRPNLMLLYDMNGRVVLRAKLDHYRQIPVDGLAKDQWPWIPGNYQLVFPDSGSRLVFTLDDALRRHQDPGQPWLPDPRSFIMPNPENVDVKNVIEVGQQRVQNGN